jgi:hypothetical protein
MTKFVKLTAYWTGEPVVVGVDFIMLVTKTEAGTLIEMDTFEAFSETVTESVNEIYMMLR